MKRVAPAAGDHIDGCPGIPAVLSREVRGLNLDLIDEIDPHVVDLRSVTAGIQVESSVDGEQV
jgi:hypothetical protein